MIIARLKTKEDAPEWHVEHANTLAKARADTDKKGITVKAELATMHAPSSPPTNQGKSSSENLSEEY